MLCYFEDSIVADMEKELKFHPITIADRDRVQNYLDKLGIVSSGMQFSTMLLWGFDGRTQIAEKDDVLYIVTRQQNCYRMIAPLTEKLGEYAEILSFAEKNDPHELCDKIFYGVTKELKPAFENAGYAVSECRDYDDYVYSVQDLTELSGKAYHGKRNHINAFLESNSFEYVAVTPSMEDECMRVFDAWLDTKDEEDADERRATKIALENMEALGLLGGGIRVNGILKAFSLGQKINGDTALIHIEKAVDERGLFPLINREFLSHAFADMLYVNREEDMGSEGLRKAKLSYKPLRFEPSYTARKMS